MISNIVSDKVKNLGGSKTLEFREIAQKMIENGESIIQMIGGEPCFDTPETIKKEAISALEQGYTRYVTPQGITELREEIVKKLRRDNNMIVDTDNIVITASAKNALFMSLFSILNPGDEVMVLDPSWVSYGPMISMCGGKPISVSLRPEDNYRLTETILKKYVTSKTKALLYCSPSNPTGRVMSKDELDIIRNFVKEHNIVLISDEVYEKIVFDNHKHISIASYPDISKNVITINGFSKGYAMCGWRLGFLVCHKDLVSQIMKVQTQTITCATSFVQKGATKAFLCEDDVESMRKEYLLKRDYIVSELNSINGITCAKPEGAFYVTPKIEYKGLNSDELSLFLLKEGRVGTVSGSAFGTGLNKHVRISFACSMGEIVEAVERIKNLLDVKGDELR